MRSDTESASGTDSPFGPDCFLDGDEDIFDESVVDIFASGSNHSALFQTTNKRLDKDLSELSVDDGISEVTTHDDFLSANEEVHTVISCRVESFAPGSQLQQSIADYKTRYGEFTALHFVMVVPPTYPFQPPTVAILPTVRLNVVQRAFSIGKSGTLCLAEIHEAGWSPITTLSTLVRSICVSISQRFEVDQSQPPKEVPISEHYIKSVFVSNKQFEMAHAGRGYRQL